MKKQIKTIIAVLLSVLLCCSVLTALPVSAFAATTAEQTLGATSGTTGDCTWKFDVATGTLTISGNGAMADYGFDDNCAPWKNIPFKQVVIESGVTRIGNLAFYNCSSLTSVTIPDSVLEIGFYTFTECAGLQTVSIGNSVKCIPIRAFRQCTNLKSVMIGDSVSRIDEWAFEQCTALNSITVSNKNKTFDSRNNCNAIIRTRTNTLVLGCKKSIIPNSVKTIGDNAFCFCTGLTSVNIPDSVTSIELGAFSGCTGLTSINIPNSVTDIGISAFCGCTGLTSVNIPDSVTSIEDEAFEGCTGLTSITIPESVTSIDDGAFEGCTGLTSVTIPNSVTSIGRNAFSDTAWFDNQSDGLVYAGKVAYEYKGICPAKVEIKDSTLGIADYAFGECEGLTNITIPDSVISIGDDAFSGCTGLASVNIPDSVISIGDGAFYDCNSLTSVNIPNSVTSVGRNAFSDTAWFDYQPDGLVYTGKVAYQYKGICPAKVKIKAGTLGIADSAFEYCMELTSVTIPNSVTYIGEYAFEGCTGLTSVTIPDNVTSINDSAFSWCEGLTSVTLGNSVTSIGDNAFCSCTGLTNVTIPDSVTSISDSAFSWCKGLTSVTLGNSVTSIGDNAFCSCTGLTSVTIPDSITFIGEYAFGYYVNDSDDYEYEDDYDYFDEYFKKVDFFTIYGKKGSTAETYANENGFEFIATAEPIEKTDKSTGVNVTLREDLTLKVDDATGSDRIKNMVLMAGKAVVKAYDITLLKDGAETQPDGSVTVKIPCDKENAKVYRVEADNTLTDMHAVYENGYLVFTTDHFSVYVVTESQAVIIGDLNGDGKVNGADAGLLNRYTSGWDGYAEKIKNMDAADINRDGKVNGADSGLLNRYTSGWDTVKKYFTAA